MTATLARITVGGLPLGNLPGYSDTLICCPACNGRYPMAIRPSGLLLTPVGIVVGRGYAERCPCCGEVSGAGSVLGYGGMA